MKTSNRLTYQVRWYDKSVLGQSEATLSREQYHSLMNGECIILNSEHFHKQSDPELGSVHKTHVLTLSKVVSIKRYEVITTVEELYTKKYSEVREEQHLIK